MPKFIEKIGPRLCELSPKRIVLSGPSGFLGSRLLKSILEATTNEKNL